MQLRSLYLPLLALTFVLCFANLPPVTALDFLALLGEGLPGLPVPGFPQAYVPSENAILHTLEEAAARSKDVRETIGELKEHMNTVVDGAKALLDELHEVTVKRRASDERGDSEEDIAKDLERAFEGVLEELKVMFPAPEEALGHEERQRVVTVALDKVGSALITVCVKYKMDEERARSFWETIRAALEKLIMLLGDFAEEHPFLLWLLWLLFIVLMMLIPISVSWLLHPLLRLFGFGPIGPVAGTAASWAQSVFYGPAVSKGSWFAILQKMAMG